METIRARGLEIAYERAGEGSALVLLHSAGDDHRIWSPQIEALKECFSVIAWDEPGAGGSSELPPDFTLADYADCLAELVSGIDLGPAHVAGLSWGGTVALALYRRHPELIATLVLVDAYAGWKGSLTEQEVEARVGALRSALSDPGADSDIVTPGLFAQAPPPRFEWLLSEIAAGARRETMLRQVSVMAEADQSDLLSEIALPTLLIWGEQDVRSPLSVAETFERQVPDSRLVVIPNAGHLSNLEEPERVTAAIREFCLAHPPGA